MSDLAPLGASKGIIKEDQRKRDEEAIEASKAPLIEHLDRVAFAPDQGAARLAGAVFSVLRLLAPDL